MDHPPSSTRNIHENFRTSREDLIFFEDQTQCASDTDPGVAQVHTSHPPQTQCASDTDPGVAHVHTSHPPVFSPLFLNVSPFFEHQLMRVETAEN